MSYFQPWYTWIIHIHLHLPLCISTVPYLQSYTVPIQHGLWRKWFPLHGYMHTSRYKFPVWGPQNGRLLLSTRLVLLACAYYDYVKYTILLIFLMPLKILLDFIVLVCECSWLVCLLQELSLMIFPWEGVSLDLSVSANTAKSITPARFTGRTVRNGVSNIWLCQQNFAYMIIS